MSWKPALFEYVSAANARETEPVADETLLPAERARLRRLAASYADRGAKPLGCDTRLIVRREREREREVVADLELRRTVYVRTRGVEHAEERVDRERVTLQRTEGGAWAVVRAEPIVQERHAGGPASGFGDAGAPGARTAPFLNERVLVRSYSEGWERASLYDREAARDYAERHWNEPNPQFIHFDVDCTNYVSQCLYAGGAPMAYSAGRESGWWYRGRSGSREHWSYSWSVAHALHWYLMGGRNEGLAADRVPAPEDLAIGDVICYDFDGDGRFEHSAIVTGADGSGMPLVNAHTTNSRARYWDYRDSYAWTDRTDYRFFRIRDRF
ncbi:amidase domain-containing protein [Paenibacillus antri]|uniref:Amidase domain-containing protein n=1 Tax=Paenibacillus antri TaxID=2582848 RepID=A0A5R9G7G4_9BACL|nr:amidase domain-containing protein [Paenibacillus antri]TLS48964.1 amidase domain-containing protein [Paenibacillus antri]